MRIAIHVHVFYLEGWPRLSHCIANFQKVCGVENVSLYVTYPDSVSVIRNVVSVDQPKAQLIAVPNRGYDVAPFLEVINRLDLSSFDFVVKLHTKRDSVGWLNYRHMASGQWNSWLTSFCSSESHVARTLDVFRHDPSIGMLSDRHVIVEREDNERSDILAMADEIVRKHYGKVIKRDFVAGTMFIVRAGCLTPLQGAFSFSDFTPVETVSLTAVHKSELAHAFERVFGYCVAAQGMYLADWRSGSFEDRYWKWRKYSFTVMRGLFQIVKIALPKKKRPNCG